MAIKYYQTSFDQIEDQHLNNSIDIGMNKKDVKNWIKYIMDGKPIVKESLATRILKSGRAER